MSRCGLRAGGQREQLRVTRWAQPQQPGELSCHQRNYEGAGCQRDLALSTRAGDVCGHVELGHGYSSPGKSCGLGRLRIIRVEVAFKSVSCDEITAGV